MSQKNGPSLFLFVSFVLILVLAGGVLLFQKWKVATEDWKVATPRAKEVQTDTLSQGVATSSQAQGETIADSSGGEQAAPDSQQAIPEMIVSYSGEGFSPREVTLKQGQTVVFKNESAQALWTASDPHPFHTLYPEKGGCNGGSAFDSCASIQPGESWSFSFQEVGQWPYHNHTNASHKGVVIVVE